MEVIYNIVANKPEYFAWAIGLVAALWGAFKYFNKQSHDKAMEKLKHSLKIKETEAIYLIQKLQELEALAGEAKEVAISYHSTIQKKERIPRIQRGLEQLAGQLSEHRSLVQTIRDLNNRCAIMTEEDPHESCRAEILRFYQDLLTASGNIKQSITA